MKGDESGEAGENAWERVDEAARIFHVKTGKHPVEIRVGRGLAGLLQLADAIDVSMSWGDDITLQYRVVVDQSLGLEDIVANA